MNNTLTHYSEGLIEVITDGKSGYDHDGDWVNSFVRLRDDHTKDGAGCVAARYAKFTDHSEEGYYPSRAYVASLQRKQAKLAEHQKRLTQFESYGER